MPAPLGSAASDLCPGLRAHAAAGVLTVVMEHIPTRNAFDDVRSRALETLLTDLVSSSSSKVTPTWMGQPVFVLALSSTCKGVWASGGDLSEIQTRPDTALETMGRMKQVALALESLPCMSVALLNGQAIGGGAELALACDERWLVHEGACLELRQREWGLPAGWDGLRSLTRAARGFFSERAAALAFVMGTRWEAPDLLRTGLASRDYREAQGRLQAALEAAAAQLSRCPTRLTQSYLNPRGEGPRFEDFWLGPDHTAALAAHEAKRMANTQPQKPPKGPST